MGYFENSTELGKYFETKLAVIEMNDGETEEEAWHRYLTLHPEYANTHIKIFHYPVQKSLDKAKATQILPSPKQRGEKIHG